MKKHPWLLIVLPGGVLLFLIYLLFFRNNNRSAIVQTSPENPISSGIVTAPSSGGGILARIFGGGGGSSGSIGGVPFSFSAGGQVNLTSLLMNAFNGVKSLFGSGGSSNNSNVNSNVDNSINFNQAASDINNGITDFVPPTAGNLVSIVNDANINNELSSFSDILQNQTLAGDEPNFIASPSFSTDFANNLDIGGVTGNPILGGGSNDFAGQINQDLIPPNFGDFGNVSPTGNNFTSPDNFGG